HVPAATTPHAFGARRSIQSHVGIGWPVSASMPKPAQKPSLLFFSLGMEPSTMRRNGSSKPSAARWKVSMKSAPLRYARTALCSFTLGRPGMAPRRTSSMLGWVADVLLGAIPGLPKVKLHNAVLAYRNGGVVQLHLGQTRNGAEEDVLNARLGCGCHRDRIAVTTQPRSNPENVQFRD